MRGVTQPIACWLRSLSSNNRRVVKQAELPLKSPDWRHFFKGESDVTGRIYIVHVMSMYILTVTITTLYLCVYLVCMCSCVCVCACMSSLFPSLRFSQDIQSYPTHEWSMAGSTPHRLLMWKTGQSVVSDVPHWWYQSSELVWVVWVISLVWWLFPLCVCAACMCVCVRVCVCVSVCVCRVTSYNLVFYLII